MLCCINKIPVRSFRPDSIIITQKREDYQRLENSGNLSMADTTTEPATATAASGHNSVPEKSESDSRPGPATLDQSSMALPQFSYPNPGASPSLLTLPHTTIHSSIGPTTTQIPVPVPVPVPSVAAGQQFMGVPAYQTPGVPPPGVGSGMVQQVIAPPYAMAGQPLRYMPPIPNGYAGFPQAGPPGAMPPPGIPRYPMQYAPMIRPAFPPRPLVGVMPPLARPPVVGIRGPTTQLVVRPPAAPSVVSTEKPQTTVYVGKISSTVENDFMLSLLQLCGPVKSWKRPQDPTGTLKGFGFCEFESAEGVLRALRLLNKLNIDGQELMLNVNQPTRVYLDRYVEKKVESSNSKDSNNESAEKEELKTSCADTNGTLKSSEESEKPSSDKEKRNDDEISNKENSHSADFGLVTEEDKVADREALEKLKGMIEERLRDRPLPPPRTQTAIDGLGGDSTSELHSVSRDRDSDGDVAAKDSEDKVEDEKTAESKLSGYVDKNRTSSPDRNRRGNRSKDRDRESKQDKEREVERYEREREQERAKREKDKEHRSRDDDRRYKAREKEWETREREKEHWRKREREREREKAQERKWEIMNQERDSDDAYGKKRRHKTSDEEKKRRQREKEEDSTDRFREEEEIAEAKIRDEEEQKKKQYEKFQMIANQSADETGNVVLPNETSSEDRDKDADETSDGKSIGGISKGEGDLSNGIGDDSITSLNAVAADTRQSSNVPTRKLGFGLSASGKRTAVPSVFNEDEDEDALKDKKMRPLVPIDYSTDEQQTVQTSFEGVDHMVAAAEFVKRISTGNSKEEKPDLERERGKRSHERSNHREQYRHEDEGYRKEKKAKSPEKQKILDAKQLIDTIPKTKDELFSYNINWTVYDLNALHERLRPWISKKIADFLGEEEDTLVEYIVSTTQEHVSANEMLERLQTILDDEAEMFVLKMWRMLIFEIKKVETGLAVKSRS